MNHFSIFTTNPVNKSLLAGLLLVSITFSFCKEEPYYWKLTSEEQVIGDYIENNPDKYSEFAKLIESTGLSALMKIRGPYTLMLPNNIAMFEYYKKNNVSSFMDFTDSTIRYDLAYNHIIASELNTSDIGLGALRDPNGLGDYLVTEFEGADIIINKSAKIIDRDIHCSNGFIHEIDKVLEPTTKNIYEVLASNPSFKIFTEGLELTGLKDTLSIIKFPYGTKTARTRFTVLATPDSVYQRYGINDLNELIGWCRSTDSINSSDSSLYEYTNDLKSLDNPFYRYIEYHCIAGSYFLSDLPSTGLYPILSSDNNVSIKVNTDYKINENSTTKEYTGFIIPESNHPAKNGALHTINSLLPVIEPEPAVIVCETTDYFDFQQGDYIGKYYMKWGAADGLTTFKNIKWGGNYLLYYYKPNQRPNLHDDCLSMLGFWWVEITTPKIMKGKYAVTAGIWTGSQDMPSFAAYVDGVFVNEIDARPGGAIMDFGTVEYTKTEEHKVKLVCTNWGTLFWDTVIFTPIP